MPELPEVETVKTVLEKVVIGRTIKDIEVLRYNAIHGDKEEFISRLKEEKFLSMSRIGKFLIFHLSNDKVIISHLRMEGKYYELEEKEGNSKYARLVIHLDNNKKICYDDSRCFGYLKLSSESEYLKDKEIAKLGPEPWDSDVQVILKKVKRNTSPIKTALLSQELMTGLGNIYVDETLYACHIHPLTPANKVNEEQWEKIKKEASRILKSAIISGGSTIKSYHPGKDIDGNFQSQLLIYGKKGEECPQCHSIYRFIKVNGRGTTYCPTCQQYHGDKLKVAIFGKIACGKSEVLNIFKENNIATISSDDIVNELYQREDVVKLINQKFNLSMKDKVDKLVLRDYLANHPKDIKKINNLIHPLVKEEIIKFMDKKKGILVCEIPLLFESKMDNLFDVIIGVESPKEKQKQLLIHRVGDNAEKLLSINNNSTYDVNKNKADIIINNDSDLDNLKIKVNKIIDKLKARLD